MRAIRACCTFEISRQSASAPLSQFAGSFLRRFGGVFVAVMLCGAGLRGVAQTVSSPREVAVTTVLPATEIAEVQPAPFGNIATGERLPDAPEPQKTEPPQEDKPLVAAAPKTVATTTSTMPMAPMYSRVIPAGMATPQIHKWDKITLATRDLYSPSNFVDFFVSAGWSHVTNGQPNYGTDSGAFGQRLGAAAIRDTTQEFLSHGLFAVFFHEDPRYFALGPQYGFGKRTFYALTRPLITRDSSDGHAVPNISLILGQAAGVGLSNLYYPQSNRNFHDNIARFGGSLGGSALSFWMDEYTSELLKALRLRRLEKVMH